jgi:hypothetical protein
MILSPPALPPPPSVPERLYIQMLSQAVVPWTPSRVMHAAWMWLIAETGEQGAIKVSKG